MKKPTGIILTAVLVLVLSGCGAANNPGSNNANNTTNNNTTTKGATSITGKPVVYKDGTYDIKHKSTKPGYEEAVVTIKGGKIENIDLKRLDDNQKEVNYEEWNGTKNGQPNLKQFRLDLAKAMVTKQSPDVDVITGATQSSNGWKAAVSSALAKAQ